MFWCVSVMSGLLPSPLPSVCSLFCRLSVGLPALCDTSACFQCLCPSTSLSVWICPWLASTVLCCPFIVWVHLPFMGWLPGCSFFAWALCIVFSLGACHVCMAAMLWCRVRAVDVPFHHPPLLTSYIYAPLLFACMLICCWWLHLCFSCTFMVL